MTVETSPVTDAGTDAAPDVLAAISSDELDVRDVERFVQASANGAVVSFAGVVRDHDGGRSVTALEYRAHPEAARFLEECCRELAAETGLRVAAIHRVGALGIGEVALVAAVGAPHRAEAFAACWRLVDRIKQQVPIWKRQCFADGESEWVGL